jgi:putative restriction endonuclease
MSIDVYVQRFGKLRVATQASGFSPHKPCMLLAVLELAAAGVLSENRILFSPPLLERYREFFDAVRGDRDQYSPHLPFFHLRGDGFWHLQPLPGREAALGAMKTAGSLKEIAVNIAYAFLDPELYSLVLQPQALVILRESIISRWFPNKRLALQRVLDAERTTGNYELHLRGLAEGKDICLDQETYSAKVRTSGFRRTVVEAYDFRCAASGWRIVLPDGQVMVEAAHLIPFSVSGDDDPRNGISLTPTYHWALDNNLIAPGPDFRWHVSKLLDPRLRDNLALLDLDGKDILLPRNTKYRPRPDALEYRLSQLRLG